MTKKKPPSRSDFHPDYYPKQSCKTFHNQLCFKKLWVLPSETYGTQTNYLANIKIDRCSWGLGQMMSGKKQGTPGGGGAGNKVIFSTCERT